MTTHPLSVAVVGCGLIGHKRAEVLDPGQLVGCFDVDPEARERLSSLSGGKACHSLDQLLALHADVVVVATTHSELAKTSIAALRSGSHVLVEKPAGICVDDVDAIYQAAIEAGRLVKVGFNHRFHSGIRRAIEEAKSGQHGRVLYFRGRYGHGGRPGYDQEWRSDPVQSGGGEIVDQGMHLLDLSNWLLGPLPLHSSLLRTQFWNAPVDDNAVLLLGGEGGVGEKSPFALLHVSWTEWKNTFSIEIACEFAKLAVDGLVRSYGPQRLRIYRMRPEMGPPDLEEVSYPDRDESWRREWQNLVAGIANGSPLLGDLSAARYAWECVQAAQQR